MYIIALLLCLVPGVYAAGSQPQWGDLGNGTYRNPVLNADFSDPDVIRVGDRYYMVASDFHFMGMQMLESDDLVNWRYVSQVYDRLPFPEYDNNRRYGGGSWAPALRYHDGRFYVYFCTPHEGLFMASAADPNGPWSDLLLVKAVEKWEDPCPFWDEDGQAYLGHSLYGAGPIIMHRMSADGTRLLDDGVTVYEGPVAEGTKIHKINVSRVFMHDIQIGTVKNAIYFKSNRDRGGYIRDVYVSDITVKHTLGAVLRFETNYFGFRGGKHATQYEDFHIRNVVADRSDNYALFISGYPEKPVRNVFVTNMTVLSAPKGCYTHCTESLMLSNVSVNGILLPTTLIDDPDELTLDIY